MLVVITDSHVGELYAPSCGAVDHVITVPIGRQHKTLATVQTIYEQLLRLDFDRTGTIVALGGSVVGDIAGFVAATSNIPLRRSQPERDRLGVVGCLNQQPKRLRLLAIRTR